MKRSLLVTAGTAAGVTAVVSYHVATPSLVARSTGTAARASAAATAGSATTASSTTDSGSATATTTSTTTTARPTTKAAVGEAVSFQYGQLQAKVTERAGRITGVSLVSFQITDPHSQSIDSVAVPQLEQQVVAAQSAQIDGVSGASYTSQAYEQSVQSAIDKLG